jgi:hypothetical protein
VVWSVTSVDRFAALAGMEKAAEQVRYGTPTDRRQCQTCGRCRSLCSVLKTAIQWSRTHTAANTHTHTHNLHNGRLSSCVREGAEGGTGEEGRSRPSENPSAIDVGFRVRSFVFSSDGRQCLFFPNAKKKKKKLLRLLGVRFALLVLLVCGFAFGLRLLLLVVVVVVMVAGVGVV